MKEGEEREGEGVVICWLSEEGASRPKRGLLYQTTTLYSVLSS